MLLKQEGNILISEKSNIFCYLFYWEDTKVEDNAANDMFSLKPWLGVIKEPNGFIKTPLN